ncbi:hypothetical protein L7F22_054524 [Adiantum nelumboides]|nr:hypothetical protein [Adiantum nelumboides]
MARRQVPPDDEGWLCPICDCKSECLDAVNAYSGTSYGVEDSWKNIFAEAGSFGIHDENVPQVVEDWPSEDSEDADYIPGQKSNNSKLGTQGQEGSIDPSVSLTSSAESGSDSNVSDDAASRLSLLNELAEIMEIGLGIKPQEDNVSVDEEDVILMDGKRQRKEVDYKKLHDEMFGRITSVEEASEDEEWGPRNQSRKSKQSPQVSESEAKETFLKPGSGGNLETRVVTESSPIVHNKQTRVFLSQYAVEKLRAAFKENPLPSRACKERLSKQLGLSFGKVSISTQENKKHHPLMFVWKVKDMARFLAYSICDISVVQGLIDYAIKG